MFFFPGLRSIQKEEEAASDPQASPINECIKDENAVTFLEVSREDFSVKAVSSPLEKVVIEPSDFTEPHEESPDFSPSESDSFLSSDDCCLSDPFGDTLETLYLPYTSVYLTNQQPPRRRRRRPYVERALEDIVEVLSQES